MKINRFCNFKIFLIFTIFVGFYLVLRLNLSFIMENKTSTVIEINSTNNIIGSDKLLSISYIPNGTTCSEIASMVGFNQKVISYSAYGDNQGYWRGFPEILSEAKKIYSGWFVRIYTDQPKHKLLTKLSKVYKNLHICDINNLPPPMVTLKDYPFQMWRYHILGDPQVDIVNFRDSDSKILPREGHAVQKWLAGNKSLHTMRDHPKHTVPILGGMWGAKMTPSNRSKWKSLRNVMFKNAYKTTGKKNIDQVQLKDVVWPVFKNSSMSHDSYSCKAYPGSVPFPSRRVHWRFVGRQDFRQKSPHKWKPLPEPCPEECRPPNHKDWLYC